MGPRPPKVLKWWARRYMHSHKYFPYTRALVRRKIQFLDPWCWRSAHVCPPSLKEQSPRATDSVVPSKGRHSPPPPTPPVTRVALSLSLSAKLGLTRADKLGVVCACGQFQRGQPPINAKPTLSCSASTAWGSPARLKSWRPSTRRSHT